MLDYLDFRRLKLTRAAEFSNDYSFFTYDRNKLRCKVLSDHTRVTKSAHIRTTKLRFLNRQELDLQYITEEINEKLRLSLALKGTTPFTLNDFVMRFIFPLREVEKVVIGDSVFLEFEENKYYQIEAMYASIFLKNKSILKYKIDLMESQIPINTKIVFYAKKVEGELIFHCRVLPAKPTFPVIKFCNRHFFTLPIPRIVTAVVVKYFPKLFERLLYHSEVDPRISILHKICNPVAFYNFMVDREIKLSINVCEDDVTL